MDTIPVPVPDVSNPIGAFALLVAVLGGIAWAFIELLKGYSTRFNGLPDGGKAAAALLLGTLFGVACGALVAAGAFDVPMPFLAIVAAGFTGGGGFTFVRALGKAGQARQAALLLVCIGTAGLLACATLLPAQRQATTTCTKAAGVAALGCVPDCLDANTPAVCLEVCAPKVAQAALPACGEAFGGLESPEFGEIVRATIEDLLAIYGYFDHKARVLAAPCNCEVPR